MGLVHGGVRLLLIDGTPTVLLFRQVAVFMAGRSCVVASAILSLPDNPLLAACTYRQRYSPRYHLLENIP